MKTKLKQFRVAAGMTQAKVAAAVGVTQPNYHRWEAGAAPIPEAKLKRLAKVLKTAPEAILGRHTPIRVSLYDDSVGDDLSYYGEVAIHFCGGGEALLLSISEEAFNRLHRDLQGDAAFVTVESLANQTVAIRSKAISDLFFSSEAYDDYGPEHGKYTNHIDLQNPDARDWEIIECLACDEVGIEDFDPVDVERVRNMIMITDEQYEKLVADGRIKAEDLERERAKNQAKTDRILNAALRTTYQLSTGQQRSLYVDSSESLFDAFYELIDFEGGISADDMVRVEAEGPHRIIFINKSALDYVAIPTHQLNEGRVERDAEALEHTQGK
jgi:transcriptional regulator with XRE-family HTH domain